MKITVRQIPTFTSVNSVVFRLPLTRKIVQDRLQQNLASQELHIFSESVHRIAVMVARLISIFPFMSQA